MTDAETQKVLESTPTPVEIARLRRALDRQTRRHNWQIAILLIVMVISLGLGVGSLLTNTSVRRLQAVSDQSSRTAAAQQCRAVIAAQYGVKRDAVTILAARTAQQLNAIVVGAFRGERPSDELSAAYDETNRQLDVALVALQALPSQSDSYRDGVTIDGVRYRPCPKV